jgi:hypothetical protein
MSYSVDGRLLVVILFLRQTGPVLSRKIFARGFFPKSTSKLNGAGQVRRGGMGSSADKQAPYRAWYQVRNDIP